MCVAFLTHLSQVYFAGVNDRFPLGGKMTQYLEKLKVGDRMEMRGPKGTMTYLSKAFKIKGSKKRPEETRKVKHIGMISGGTGITPMLQVSRRRAVKRGAREFTKCRVRVYEACRVRVYEASTSTAVSFAPRASFAPAPSLRPRLLCTPCFLRTHRLRGPLLTLCV